MAKGKPTGWFLQFASVPFLVIGVHMARSSLMEVEGANLFGLLTGLTLFLGGLGLLVVGIRAVWERIPDEDDTLDEGPT